MSDVRSILYAESSASTDRLTVAADDVDEEDASRRSANGSRWIFFLAGGSIASTLTHTHKHTQPFNGLFSRTTWVGRYQKDKPFWILLKQEMMGWQWHQLNHMQIICTSLHTDNHANTSSLHIFYRPDALPAAQPTASKH